MTAMMITVETDEVIRVLHRPDLWVHDGGCTLVDLGGISVLLRGARALDLAKRITDAQGVADAVLDIDDPAFQ